jgi:hypothetical protein
MMGTYGMDMLNRTGADRRATGGNDLSPQSKRNSAKGYTERRWRAQGWQ